MTNKEILEKAIQKAIDGGLDTWESLGFKLAMMVNANDPIKY